MHPIIFHFQSITIYSYGLMVALGFLLGMSFSIYLAVKQGLNFDHCLDIAIYVIVASVIGARAMYVIAFWPEFQNNWLEAFMVWHGGLVFYGGMICAMLTMIIAVNKLKMSPWKLLDASTPGLALGLAIGRIGCFLNGCCYGAITNVPWAVKFPLLNDFRHPTQVYESIYTFFIFAALSLFWSKKKFDGQIFVIGLMLYSIFRFLNEMIRIEPRYLFNLSGAQWISVIFFIVAVIIYAKRTKSSV